MKRIRIGNDFVFNWAIERGGLPEDLSSVLEAELTASVFGKKQEVPFTVSGNIITVEFTPEICNITGLYNLLFTYILPDTSLSDEDRKCAVDVDAFRIVAKTAQADDSAEFSMTSDMAIALRGKSAYEIALEEGFAGTKEDWLLSLKGDDGTMSFEELTPEQKAELKGDKGDKGDPFEFNDLTPEQKAELKGDDGESAYEIWLSLGNQGTEQDFIDSLAASGVDLTSYLKIIDAENTYQPKGTYLENETDPTVPDWAKQENKPTYGVNEITGLETALSGKVDNERVLTDVPANAKFTDTTYENATTSISGLMSNTDKSKLDGVEAGANKYVHPAGTNPHGTTKADVGLGNVDNTSDANKPVSTAQQTAINSGVAEAKTYADGKFTLAIPLTQKGSASGVAELDASGKVLSSQLPSYVDDVLNYTTQSNFPTTGESGKIYITEDTNKTYRWTGSAYVEISPSIALGETSATAYRGDRGKVAYDHANSEHQTIINGTGFVKATGKTLSYDNTSYEVAFSKNTAFNKNFGTASGTVAQGNDSRIINGQTAFGWGNHSSAGYALNTALTNHINKIDNPHEVTKSQVGLGNVDNTSDANKPVSTAMQTALNGKLDANKMQVVTELPASPVSGVFYFVKE